MRPPRPDEARPDDWRPSDLTAALVSEREDVLNVIGAAFGNVAREEGVTLHEAGVIDCWGSMEEQRLARALDTDTTWQEVSHQLLEEHRWNLSFLDGKGMRYYLPAYMSWDLRSLRRPGSGVSSNLMFHLGRRDERFAILNETQSYAVYRFLRVVAQFASEDHAAQAREAIENNWHRYAHGM